LLRKGWLNQSYGKIRATVGMILGQGAEPPKSKRLMADKNQNTSSTALRVFAVLECVANFRKAVTVAEVCDSTGLDRAMAYRALMTLTEAGYLTRDNGSKTFRLSYKIVSIARFMLSDNANFEAIRAILRKIVEATGETCHYSVLEGFETVTTLKEKGDQVISVDFKIGDRGQLHSSSIGKAILAYQSEEFIKTCLARPMQKFTPFTLCNADQLRAELARVRSAGLAMDDNEMIEGMRCVAVPVHEASGMVRSGISISGPASRYTDAYLRNLGDTLLKYAGELSQCLAHPW
jgi:DNA-binding IclR family transcriptional regulator